MTLDVMSNSPIVSQSKKRQGHPTRKFTIGVGTPFLRVLFMRFKGLFLNARKNVTVRLH